MKKFLTIFLMLILSISFVFAQQSQKSIDSDIRSIIEGLSEQQLAQIDSTPTIMVKSYIMNNYDFSEQNVERALEIYNAEYRERKQIQSEVKGLENAVLRVRNEETVQKLEQVMAKIQERDRERLQNLTGLEILEDEDGEIIARGDTEKKFFGLFKVQREAQYRVMENGNIEKKTRLFDFLYANGDDE